LALLVDLILLNLYGAGNGFLFLACCLVDSVLRACTKKCSE